MTQIKPICVAVIVCESVIVDQETKNKTLVGIFNGIGCDSFPSYQPRMSVLVSLTDIRGTVDFSIELLRDNEEGESRIILLSGTLTSPNPVDVVDFVFNLINFPLKSAGVYTVRIAHKPSGAILAQRNFKAILIGKPNTGEKK